MIKFLFLVFSLNAAPGPQILLPKGVEASWVFKSEKPAASAPLFDVDLKGGLWMLPHPRLLSLPSGGFLPSKEDLRDLAFDMKGRLYLISDRAAGTLQILKKDEDKRRWIRVKEKMLLPGPGWRLASGAESMLCWGYNPETEMHEVWRLKDKRKLFASKDRIQALLPEGDKFKAVKSGISHYARLGSGAVFAAGATEVWLEGAKPLPLLEAAYTRIRARGSALYIGLREGGVLKVEGLQNLESLR